MNQKTVKTGDRVYYTGDMANVSAIGTVVSVSKDKWGTHIRIVWDADTDGEQKRDSVVSPANFGTDLCSRFWLLEDWKADQAAKIAEMNRTYAHLLNRKK